MLFSETEASQLFADVPLLGVPSVSLLVAFAQGYLPDGAELALLGNIVSKGYGCSSSLVHYFYGFEGEAQPAFLEQMEQFQPDLALIFDPATPHIRQIQIEESELIQLPDLAKIEATLELKKDLWSRLKQLKLA